MTAKTMFKALVIGATGQQGGAVAQALLERGHLVKALTRRLDSPEAQSLKRRGVELVQGDFENIISLESAMRDCSAVFAMSTPFEGGVAVERRQGRALVNAAKSCRIKHFIYSSVASADRKTQIPHFESKHATETYLRASDVPFTIFGPTFFMENLLAPSIWQGLKEGRLSLALPARRAIQLLALEDLAELVTLAMEQREAFLGRRLDVASEGLHGDEMATILSWVIGRKIDYVELPLPELEKVNKDKAAMFRWMAQVGYKVDVPRLRKRYPEVGWRNFEAWAKAQDWKDLKPVRRRPRASPPA